MTDSQILETEKKNKVEFKFDLLPWIMDHG